MNSKTSLVLMEQLIMVLVFAVAAALCLQVFVGADQIYRETGQRDRAVSIARNAAEIVKISKGNPEEAAVSLTALQDSSHLWVYYDDQWKVVKEYQEAAYRLEIQWLEKTLPGLGQAQITVTQADVPKTPLFSLMVAWQEGM